MTLEVEEIDDFRRARLADLFRGVAASVPYYRRLLAGRLHEDPFCVLASLPVLTRERVRSEFERLISERVPRRLMRFSTTGGSTGEPMPYGRDRDRQCLGLADQELGQSWAGMRRGGRVLSIWGSSFDMARHTERWRGAWNRAVYGMHYLPAFAMPSDIRPWVEEIERVKPHLILGYAGALARFAALCIEAGIRPAWAPLGSISSAEPLDLQSRTDIERVLGSPVLNRYASRELGTVAQECGHKEGLHIFEHGKVVEILDSEDRPVPSGQLGRVVVTDLWNVGFPLIRYDTGDLARLAQRPCPCRRAYRCLSGVLGRVTDFLIAEDGRAVSGLALPHLLKDFPGIERFQAMQDREGRIVLRMVCPGGLIEADRSLIRKILGDLLPGVSITIEEVSDIRVPPSGKHRSVTSERSADRFGRGR